MLANPIVDIIAAVVGLVAVVGLLVLNWKTVVKWLKEAWHWFTHLRVIEDVVKWVRSLWTWYTHLGTKIQSVIAILVPFIGIPAMIIAHWKPIETFFSNLWTNILKPIIDGIGKIAGGAISGIEHFFGIGNSNNGSSYAKVNSGAASSGDTHIHFHPGAIVVHASSGNATQTGRDVYKGIVQQAKTSSRSRGVRPATSYAH